MGLKETARTTGHARSRSHRAPDAAANTLALDNEVNLNSVSPTCPPEAEALPHPMPHLLFERSDGDDGIGALEAQASRRGGGLAAERAEAQALLAWAAATFPRGPGPVEEGHDWDALLHEAQEPGGWQVLTLSFSASPAFAEAFALAHPEAML